MAELPVVVVVVVVFFALLVVSLGLLRYGCAEHYGTVGYARIETRIAAPRLIILLQSLSHHRRARCPRGKSEF